MDGQLIVIQSKIYEIRGQKVMFDFDLAEMGRDVSKSSCRSGWPAGELGEGTEELY